MKMKTPTTTQPETRQETQTSFTQLLAKAEAEITRLSAQEKQIILQLQANQAELSALATQARAHETERSIAEESVKARRKALREAEIHAELTEGTTATNRQDVKGLEKLLKQAQTEQLVILDRITKAEQGEERRRIALETSCEQCQRDLAQLAERKEAISATKQRVWHEWGQSVFDAHTQELVSLQDALTAKEQECKSIRQEVDDLSSKAIQSLNNWSDLKEQFSSIMPYSDSTTSLLDAAIHLLDLFLTHGYEVERFDSHLFRQAGIQWGSIDTLLSWNETACLDALIAERRSEPRTFKEKKADLTRLLEVYRAHKKEERR